MDSERIKGLLALINRSPDQGDGWRNVSDTCWPLVRDMPLELVEIDADNQRIRMNDKGYAVLTFA